MSLEKSYLISREIDINASRRIPYQDGNDMGEKKCGNLRGHRFAITAICSSALHDPGDDQKDVFDFTFLKHAMMETIHEPCDHGLILWCEDEVLPSLIPEQDRKALLGGKDKSQWSGPPLPWSGTGTVGALYVIPYLPVTENLVRLWYDLLAPEIIERSQNRAKLEQIKVWETPNWWMAYPASFGG
uniref:6-carboxy-5,6,7,8-tetrahydropterin synthase n=1 Tax=Candidatus Kentrum sp. MB TaxID=2138164 RepID=A0A450X969_9GAMM|nr:MAG: 6-pyruvoyltetrahydropterin/6-carboxytetrahydropterin synthase [Candidatus Kentron sp. MB]VFK27200.1 MAG: 6-pyruvoyltetrahydropterin/6-carboxytetrahydropterin synthase [Candidatus Kentron sp. MB]VFK75089.1 MAG: 6-pyruvoyltetrahydropterin/6-carboxytetrahydropterin synthase [Candidatus Kentron sp. MB]